ncbi:hypothetical protein HK099_007808 [Clydaea vesicula]|uniref:Uncharacterized protein n=1 Tax=Clydaea vesicula TaxID=447962 RepID=A0AAD5TZG7_9FUNG|nr:hypothetical protein HK099_007808 [Clydaea vesicula]
MICIVHCKLNLEGQRKLTSNKTPEVAIVENNLDPRPFIIPFLFTFFVLAIVKKKWSEDTTTEQNFNTTAVPSNNAIPLNERSLYYYQEEFGDEQLPKYTKDASDFNYEPSREDISLQVLNSDTTTNTTTVAGPPTFEESQVSTGQNIEQGETLNEIQQSGNTESIENAETTISIPTTTNEQTVNSI